MRQKMAFVALAVIAPTAILLGWAFWRNSRITSRYEAVRLGTSEQEVLRLLGTPSWVEPCGKSFGTPKPNCTEYIYRNSFAPVIPEYHSVSLDPSGHVVHKYVYSSP